MQRRALLATTSGLVATVAVWGWQPPSYAQSCSFGSIVGESEIEPVAEACSVVDRVNAVIDEVTSSLGEYLQEFASAFNLEVFGDVLDEILTGVGIHPDGFAGVFGDFLNELGSVFAAAGLPNPLGGDVGDASEISSIYDSLPQTYEAATGPIGIDPITFEREFVESMSLGLSGELDIYDEVKQRLVVSLSSAIENGSISAATDLSEMMPYSLSRARLGINNPTLLAHIETEQAGNLLSQSFVESLIGPDGQAATVERLDRYARVVEEAAGIVDRATTTLDDISSAAVNGEMKAAADDSESLDISAEIAAIDDWVSGIDGVTNTQDIVRTLVEIEGEKATISSGILTGLQLQNQLSYRAAVQDTEIAQLLLNLNELAAQQTALELEDAAFDVTRREISARNLAVLSELERKLDSEREREFARHQLDFYAALRHMGSSALNSDPARVIDDREEM